MLLSCSMRIDVEWQKALGEGSGPSEHVEERERGRSRHLWRAVHVVARALAGRRRLRCVSPLPRLLPQARARAQGGARPRPGPGDSRARRRAPLAARPRCRSGGGSARRRPRRLRRAAADASVRERSQRQHETGHRAGRERPPAANTRDFALCFVRLSEGRLSPASTLPIETDQGLAWQREPHIFSMGRSSVRPSPLARFIVWWQTLQCISARRSVGRASGAAPERGVGCA